MGKCFLALLVLFLAGFFAFAQQENKPDATPPLVESKAPAEAVKLANPVKPSSESVARGKRAYGYDCAMCHGKDGDGKGDLAADMKVKLGDFRAPETLKNQTDGELFYIIKNGKGEMPSEGDRAKTDAIWDLVNYVRSLSKAEAAKEKAAAQ
jgi:mono/diheme cytochrome c family protein